MSYSFEDSTSGGSPDGGTIETSAQLTRGGVPRWLMAILGVGAVVLFIAARSNLPSDEAATTPTTSPSFGFTTTTGPSGSASGTEEGSGALVTSPPNQLTHNDLDLVALVFGGFDRSIAVRGGSAVLVVDPASGTAHRIELPVAVDVSDSAISDFDGRRLALIAGKVITYDSGFLRSLSVNGGVDLLLSNSSLGFEVLTPTAIVAATQSVNSLDPEPEIRLVPQGVHFPSARDQIVGVFGVPDLDLLPPGAEVAVVQDKIFVLLDGELHRQTPDGLVSLGPGRAFAASESAAIIERCLVLFEYCAYERVDLNDLSASPVPLNVPLSFSRSNIVMAADGNSLVVLDDGTEEQTLVDIADGNWNVVHEFDFDRLTAAAFDTASQVWILADRVSLMFWDGTLVGAWGLDDVSEISEIAIAR